MPPPPGREGGAAVGVGGLPGEGGEVSLGPRPRAQGCGLEERTRLGACWEVRVARDRGGDAGAGGPGPGSTCSGGR